MTDPDAIAVPTDLLRRCLRMSELLVAAAVMECDAESVRAARQLNSDLADLLKPPRHAPTSSGDPNAGRNST